jgi:hypothetical protein
MSNHNFLRANKIKTFSKITLLMLLLVTTSKGFAQKKQTIAITGTVYLAQGVSSGMKDGGTSMSGGVPYANKIIYIVNSLKWVTTRTNAKGEFFVKIEPGRYIVERDSMERTLHKMYFYDEIEVKKKGGPYKVNLKEVEFGE